MEEEKLQAAKSILLESDGNKFAAIKAFMAQYGTDIDTAASYINQAYIILDVPNTTVAYCEPNPQPMLPAPPVQEDPVTQEYSTATQPVEMKEYVVEETTGQKVVTGLKVGFGIFAVLVYLAKAAVEIGWVLLKLFLYVFVVLPFKIVTFFLLLFYTDKAINSRKRSYWDRW